MGLKSKFRRYIGIVMVMLLAFLILGETGGFFVILTIVVGLITFILNSLCKLFIYFKLKITKYVIPAVLIAVLIMCLVDLWEKRNLGGLGALIKMVPFMGVILLLIPAVFTLVTCIRADMKVEEGAEVNRMFE